MRKSTYCNCHIFSNQDILKSNINSSFCEKCGCILLKDKEGSIFYTLKLNQNMSPYDINPIIIIKNMKKNTEENYPFIGEDFNINKADINNLGKELNSINIYLNYRKRLLLTLQKLIIQFDYSDRTFYQCLFYLDTFLSHHLNDDISEEEIIYYFMGYFLSSLKFVETDAYIPSLNDLNNIFKEYNLSEEKINYYEIISLKKINYNVFSYSSYDWIFQLINNGIVFNCEIDSSNEEDIYQDDILIDNINKYILESLLYLTKTNLFFKYSPMYIALSLIQISREKFINKKMIKPELFFELINIYGINPSQYKKCYDEIESELEEINYQEIDNNLNEQITERNFNTIRENDEEKKCGEQNKIVIENLITNQNIQEKERFRTKLCVGGVSSRKKFKIRAKTKEKINKTIEPINNVSIKKNYNCYNSANKKNEKTNRNELQQIKSRPKLFKSTYKKYFSTNINYALPLIKNKEEKSKENNNIKLFSHKNLFNIFKIESKGRKIKLTSNKFNKIKAFEKFDFHKIKFNVIESNKTNGIYNYKNNYKFNNIPNNLIIKTSFPKEDLKTIKN